MVVGVSSDIYSPFRHATNPDEGAQSSEGSSGFQSPTHFGTSFSPPHDDSSRYHHDQFGPQNAAAIVAPQYHYTSSLNVQQHPHHDAPLEMPISSALPATFPGYYTLSLPRNHTMNDFSVQQLSNSRPLSLPDGGPLDLRYTSERRLPGGPPHDPSHSRPTRVSSGTSVGGALPTPMSPPSEPIESSTSASVAGGSRQTRKEISTVVIACRQCRGRKIRCDSTRPVCHNCVRRSDNCEYDPAPKRRGPDKNPGTRHRRCKRRPPDDLESPPSPKRKRTTVDRSSAHRDTSSSSPVKENMASERRPSTSSRSQERPRLGHDSSPIELRITTDGSYTHAQSPTSRSHPHYAPETGPYIKSSFPRQLDVNIMRSPHTQHQKSRMLASPAVEHNQKVWWNEFLSMFTLEAVEQELRYLFTDTSYWLSFFNIDYFIKTLLDEQSRMSIQPAFIYAGLAMSTLMKSSEVEFKAPGRERALWLRGTAQAHLDKSLASQWIDPSLAEAALILALFESSAHPSYNPDRVEAALLTLDHIIQRTSLSTIDANDPDVVHYPAGSVPVIMPDPHTDNSPRRVCACIAPDTPEAPNLYSSWSYFIPWDPTWTESEIRDEECRRLCWASLSLMCNYVSQCVVFERPPPDFFLTNPSNYAILFPGEVLDRASPAYHTSSSLSTKESVWALYCRSMLLWSFTDRMRTSTISNDDKVELIYEAQAEVQALQDSLDVHKCNLDTTIMYMCREYIHNTQISITQTLRNLQGFGNGPPIFIRKHAEDWIDHQHRVIQIVRTTVNPLGGPQGHELSRRPYQVIWFTNQLSICLVLWDYDHGLKSALVLAKLILIPVEVMTELWPCPALEHQATDLRLRLINACLAGGIDPPLQRNYTLPSL